MCKLLCSPPKHPHYFRVQIFARLDKAIDASYARKALAAIGGEVSTSVPLRPSAGSVYVFDLTKLDGGKSYKPATVCQLTEQLLATAFSKFVNTVQYAKSTCIHKFQNNSAIKASRFINQISQHCLKTYFCLSFKYMYHNRVMITLLIIFV